VRQMGSWVARWRKLLNARELSRRSRPDQPHRVPNPMDGMDELDGMDIDATLVKIGDVATIPWLGREPPRFGREPFARLTVRHCLVTILLTFL
jgi:hypothetical protein